MELHGEAYYREVGRRIARRRRILNLPQREVGARLGGLRRSYISELESGRYQSMKLEQLVALARVLETDVNYLVGYTDEDPGTVPPMRCLGVGVACRYALSPTPACTTPLRRTSYA